MHMSHSLVGQVFFFKLSELYTQSLGNELTIIYLLNLSIYAYFIEK